MSKKTTTSQSASGREKDYVTNKLLMVFTIAFVMILALMNIGRMMKRINLMVTAWNATKITAIAALVIMVCGIIYAIVAKSRGIDTKYKLSSGKNIAVVAAFIALCFGILSFAFNETILPLLYVLIPAVAALYIVFYSYQREFFAVCLIAGFGSIGVWIVSSAISGGLGQSHIPLLFTSFSVIFAVALICTILIQIAGGAIKLGSNQLRIFSPGMRYGIIYTTFAILIAVFALSVLTSGIFTYYFVFGLIGYIVLVGIYFTVKLL